MDPKGTDKGTDNQSCDGLSLCSDEELVGRCRRTRLTAPCFSELIYRYFPFIKSKAAQLCPSPSACDDFVQEGLLGLISAVKGFDPEKGEKFSAYAYSCVSNRMRSAAAGISRLQERENGSDEPQAEDLTTPESILISRELFGSLERLLSRKEYEIFMMYVSGLSCGEIAARLGISPKSADNAVQRSRRKLRAELEGDKKGD